MQELGSGKTKERPVRLGGALVTVVEPHRGHEVAYNRWYERDHLYAGCMIGAWTLAGARFVATADLKALRYPDPSPVLGDADGASYVSIYWVLAGKFGEWIQWGSAQVNWLIEHDRMFEERDHVHTLMYRHRSEFEDDDGVPIELALDHRSPYLVMIVGELADGVELDAVDAWFRERPPLGTVGNQLTPLPLPDTAPPDVRANSGENRFCQLWFVDDDLPTVWGERFAPLGEEFAAAGLGDLLAVSPFRATIPGTDTYTDRLWD